MKIKMIDFRLGGRVFAEHQLPYSNGQEVEGTTDDVARYTKQFLDAGLNVMSYHIHSTGDMVICVDYLRFQPNQE
jgi:hypothetical protein